MKNFIQITIQLATNAEAEIALAELSEGDFYAFEQNENILLAYITEQDFEEEELIKLIPASASYTYSVIKDRNWNEEWESNLQPVIINSFVGIRPSFHEPLKAVQHEIIITPKMSFGTGHHATTFLMIELMQKINFKGKSVLDFGTGTGVLAILAEKLGATSVMAIDYDEWSILNAIENIGCNDCKNIIVEQTDTITGISNVDIILANINLAVLEKNAENISLLSGKKSVLVASGFLAKDEEHIVSIFIKNGFIKKRKFEKDEWVALRFENQ